MGRVSTATRGFWGQRYFQDTYITYRGGAPGQRPAGGQGGRGRERSEKSDIAAQKILNQLKRLVLMARDCKLLLAPHGCNTRQIVASPQS
jgi:hypothetical protein